MPYYRRISFGYLLVLSWLHSGYILVTFWLCSWIKTISDIGPKFCLLLTSLKIIPSSRSAGKSPQPENFSGFVKVLSLAKNLLLEDTLNPFFPVSRQCNYTCHMWIQSEQLDGLKHDWFSQYFSKTSHLFSILFYVQLQTMPKRNVCRRKITAKNGWNIKCTKCTSWIVMRYKNTRNVIYNGYLIFIFNILPSLKLN